MNLIPRHLFQCFGVELEYMVVDDVSLNVRPIADELLKTVAGDYVSEIDRDGISWSNELVSHLIELKSTEPVESLSGQAERFLSSIADAQTLLSGMGARLMPTAMHPWMDPIRETRIWPHEYREIYETYDRIFDCRRHGWANLQSVHLNLPFHGDDEFARLHAAVRVILPLLPALAASSPIVEGKVTGWMDNRVEVYRTNSARIPSIAGEVIPEPLFTRAEYETEIFKTIYADIAPHDPEEMLCDEFLNARGAIARFGRGSIEIRLLDIQETPFADLAICQLVTSLVKEMTQERWSGFEQQKAWGHKPLSELLRSTSRYGEETLLDREDYLQLFGLSAPCLAGQVWKTLLEKIQFSSSEEFAHPLIERILTRGTLARRILQALGGQNVPSRKELEKVYRRLCECLLSGEQFLPESC